MTAKQAYPPRNYALGEYLLTLRSRTKLTQAELAARIGVHRRSIQKWESGETYPTAERLRAFIEVLVALAAFTIGQERAEAAELWQRVSQGSPQQLPRFDEAWLAQILTTSTSAQQAATTADPVGQRTIESVGVPSVIDPPMLREAKHSLNLPFQPTALLGRSAELNEIGKLLRDPTCRLLTLLGPGGIGKTRLAQEIAAQQSSGFKDGVLLIALTAVSAPHQIVLAVGEALNLAFAGQRDPTLYLLDYLRTRHMLLLFDDFEHLLAGADLVQAMLQAAPQLKILITSRTRLNLQAEWLFDVEGLAYPPSDSYSWGAAQSVMALTDYSAVQLFIQRATQIQPSFALTETTLLAIVRICQYVAGMPLAIELAAANVRLLPIGELERQLRSNLDLLATTLRDVPARHRSLRAIFTQSWQLLDEHEQILFSRLAVFRGSWTTAAAEQVAQAAFPRLAALIDKSLVRQVNVEPQGPVLRSEMNVPAPRFILLEPIREYALERLATHGELAALQRTHASYYLALTEAAAAKAEQATGDAAFKQLDQEHNNLRAVLQWACADGDHQIGLQLAGALTKFWRRQGAYREGRTWLEALLALDEQAQAASSVAIRLRAIQGAAWLASDQHDYARAAKLFEQGMALRRLLGEPADETNILTNAALEARAIGQYAQATTLLEAVVAQRRALGNRQSFSNFGLGTALFQLGSVQREQGDLGRASALFEECVQFHRTLGDREGMTVGLLGLSDIARDQGDVIQIRTYGADSLALARELGMQWAVGFALNNLARAAYLAGDLAQAFDLSRESVAIFRAQKAEGSLAEVLITLGQILQAQHAFTAAHQALTEALALAWAVGPRLFVAAALEALAKLATQAGHSLQGAALLVHLLAAAATLRMQMGTPIWPADQATVEDALALSRATFGVDAWTTMWTEAVHLPLEQLLRTIPEVAAFTATSPSMTTQRTTSAHQLSSRIDWGLAQDVPVLYGRADELATLTRWVLKEQCRVVTLVGLGGIGKTSLALTFARQAATNFAAVVFCSLGEAPPFPELLDHLLHRVALIHRLAAQQSVAPTPVVDKLALLIGLLRQERCLLILDNLETLFAVGTTDAHYQAGYEAYETFFKTLSETPHQSCLLLTSRERLPELAAIEGPRMPVRSLQLPGLAEEACRALLTDQDLAGTPDDAAVLARQYAGNPLALKLVADPIRALFSGDIGAFLREGNLFFNGVGQLLAQQISRASFLEQTLLTWLAIGREPIALDQIMQDLAGGTAKGPSRTLVLAALHALWRRNLIERGQGHLVFSLQRVVLEYLTERLVDRAADELQRGHFDDLRHHALIQATAKEYVRHSQERLIATPLLARLSVSNASAEMVEQQLLARLAAQRNQPLEEQGYGPGNLINLLRLLRTHLRGLDLAQLAIRQAYLQGVAMQDASLANAFVHNTVFTDIFDALTAVTISSTGEDWAAVSRRGEVLVWAAGGQTLQRTWRAHTALVWTLAFSPDGNTLASGSWDGTVKLWDVATGALRWTGKHASQVNRVAFAPDGQWLASCGSDATVQLWEVQGGALRQTLPHPAPVAVVAWCPLHPIASATSVHLLASGDLAGAIRLWSGQQDSTAQAALVCVQTLLEHTTWVDGLAFAPDGRTLASASYDNTIKLWTIEEPGAPNAERAHLRATLTTHMKWVHRVVWRPDGRVLASCSFDRTVWLWDIEQHNFRAPLQGHNAVVYDLAFTPDNHSLLSASEDGTLRLWDVDNSQCTRMMAGYTGALYDVDWSPDGTQLVSVGTDTLLTLYTITANTGTEDAQVPTQILQGHTNSVFGVSWQPSGHWLASSELDNTIRLWDTRTGAVFQVIHHPEDAANLFYGLAWSPDGQQLASGTAKRGVLVWPIQTNQPRWISQEFPTKIRHVAWHPDGTLVAGGGDDGAVYVWQASDGVLLQRMAGHPSMITSLVWSPTGAYLAASGSGREDGELAIWDVARGERVGALTGHPGLAYALAWGPENNLGELVLISGGADGVLRWWHVQSGACIHARPAHHGAVQGLRRNPAGTLLASCGDDGAIMLCALQTGEQHRTLRRERPYERMKVTGLRGLTEAQRAALLALGAVGD